MNEKKLIDELRFYHWSPEQVRLAIRSKCKCEYCDKDLLEHIDNHKLWQVDHIIPKNSNYEKCDDFDNKAITCTQCNKDMKGKWNPAKEIGYDRNRKEYIGLTKEFIKNKRASKNEELKLVRELFLTYFIDNNI